MGIKSAISTADNAMLVVLSHINKNDNYYDFYLFVYLKT